MVVPNLLFDILMFYFDDFFCCWLLFLLFCFLTDQNLNKFPFMEENIFDFRQLKSFKLLTN